MGQQGWEQVQRSFLWETIAKRTEEFYINMLGLQECVFCSFAFFPIIFFHVCEFNHNMDRGGASCLGSSSSISSCSWHWCRATVEVMPSLREIEKGMQCKSAHPHSVAQKILMSAISTIYPPFSDGNQILTPNKVWYPLLLVVMQRWVVWAATLAGMVSWPNPQFCHSGMRGVITSYN